MQQNSSSKFSPSMAITLKNGARYGFLLVEQYENLIRKFLFSPLMFMPLLHQSACLERFITITALRVHSWVRLTINQHLDTIYLKHNLRKLISDLFCLCACMCTHVQVTMEARKGYQISWAWSYRILSAPHYRCWKQNPGSLQNHFSTPCSFSLSFACIIFTNVLSSFSFWLSWNQLCRPGQIRTHRDLPASASLAQVLGLKVCATTAWLPMYFEFDISSIIQIYS